MNRSFSLALLAVIAMLPVGLTSAMFRAMSTHMAVTNGLSPDEMSHLDIGFMMTQLVMLLLAPLILRRCRINVALRRALMMAAVSHLVIAVTDHAPLLQAGAWLALGACASLILVSLNLLILARCRYRTITVITALILLCSTLLPMGVYPWLLSWLAEETAWQFLSYLLAGMLLTAQLMAEWVTDIRQPQRERKSNVLPYLLMTGCLVLIAYLLMRGSYYNWFDHPRFRWMTGVTAMLALGALVLMQAGQRSGHTLNRKLLTNLHNNVFMYNGFLAGFGVMASGALVANFLSHVMHYSHENAGLIQLPSFLAMLAGMLLSVVAANQHRFPRDMITPIGVLMIIGSVVMFSHLPSYAGPDELLFPLCLRGLGVGLLNVSVTIAMLAHFKPDHRPEGISVFYIFRTLGGLAGSAIFARIMQITRYESMSELARTLDNGGQAVEQYTQAMKHLALTQGYLPSGTLSAGQLSQTLKLEASTLALSNTFLAFVIAILLLAPVMIIGKKLVARHQSTSC
ncbi:MFS transporter [Photobacterium sp. 53610]|uniref:MFS transporter n=1 Tax=Photobacterium sp. 53610 TaxID=3102789 RepID=UPI002ED94C51